MKRVKHLLLASYPLPTFLGTQGMTDASFLEITPDAQSAGVAGTGLAITNNGNMAISHNASTIAFSQDVMGASYPYADINKDFGAHNASFFYRIGRGGKHGLSVGFRYYKDADFHWQDDVEDHAHTQNVGAAYLGNVAKSLSFLLILRYPQVKACKDADGKGSVSVDFGTSYRRSVGILDEMASWTIGLQAANLGNKLDGQKLPAQLGLGGVIDLPLSTGNHSQVVLDFNYLLPSEYRHLQTGIGVGYNFLKYGIICGGHHFGDNDKGTDNYGTLDCGVSLWPIRTDFSYALAGRDCSMYKIWQFGVGIVF